MVVGLVFLVSWSLLTGGVAVSVLVLTLMGEVRDVPRFMIGLLCGVSLVNAARETLTAAKLVESYVASRHAARLTKEDENVRRR